MAWCVLLARFIGCCCEFLGAPEKFEVLGAGGCEAAFLDRAPVCSWRQQLLAPMLQQRLCGYCCGTAVPLSK